MVSVVGCPLSGHINKYNTLISCQFQKYNLNLHSFLGWLYDITRSYAVSFISIGVLITLGGALLFIIPCLKRFKGKKGAV